MKENEATRPLTGLAEDPLGKNTRRDENPGFAGLDPRTIRMFEEAATLAVNGLQVTVIYGGEPAPIEVLLGRLLLQATEGKSATQGEFQRIRNRIGIYGRDHIYSIDYNGMQHSKPGCLLVDFRIIEQFSAPILSMYHRFGPPSKP